MGFVRDCKRRKLNNLFKDSKEHLTNIHTYVSAYIQKYTTTSPILQVLSETTIQGVTGPQWITNPLEDELCKARPFRLLLFRVPSTRCY